MGSNLTQDPLSIAYYCTGHGLGHATRAIEVCKHLVERGHSVTVVTGAPARVFIEQIPPERFVFRKATLDSGSKQLDPFTVDMRASLEEYYATCVVQRSALMEQEVAWLKANKFDLVVSDVPPLVCAAAAAAGIPAVCVSNFSWDFIYSEYLTTQRRTEFRQLVWQIARDYSQAALLLRLPGHVPMPAFQHVEDVPLVVRKAKTPPAEVRASLGLSDDVHIAVLIYGGHKAELSVRQNFLPDGWVCVVCNGGKPLSDEPLPTNFVLAPANIYTPDLVAASDCVIGKIGYGTMSECLGHNKPLVFVRRDHFNEEPFLRKVLEMHGAAVEIRRRDFLEGHWAPHLLRASSLQVSYSEPTNGAEVVAQRLEQVARNIHVARPDPMARLRDTIVFGYLMQGPRNGAVDVPEWYISGMDPSKRRMQSHASLAMLAQAAPHPTSRPGWELAAGSPELLEQLPDALDFLDILATLDAGGPGADADAELPERRAARGLFRWDDDVVVTRAPGRLDVMGGIADYSGSLVLQLPIREACHVALQLHPLDQQRVWKHMQVRHDKLGGARPALRVVSFNADATNRAPTFDMDLDDLFVRDTTQPCALQSTAMDTAASSCKPAAVDTAASSCNSGKPSTQEAQQGARAAALSGAANASDGASSCSSSGTAFLCAQADAEPLPYAQLNSYFKQDPATSWAAYVAGCLLVLASEKGLRYSRGISILVSSDVPEGKGVSSSAAIEVAVMSGLAAAHGLSLSGRELALLCQRVENMVVGAPCGVMDQMTSVLGQEGKLLALLCQPAEVQGHVAVPAGVRFWGVDSGIRHSVGGADYGSVRVGTFMGLRIMREIDAERIAASTSSGGAGAAAAAPSRRGADRHGVGDPSTNRGPGAAGDGAVALEPAGHAVLTRAASSLSAPQLCSNGYLADVAPSVFRDLYEAALPESISGTEFVYQYGAHLDDVTVVHPNLRYAVRVPSSHPVGENFRVNAFRAMLSLLQAASCDDGSDDSSGSGGSPHKESTRASGSGSSGSGAPASPALVPQLGVLGELMFQSHASYSACGLGSSGTNRLVSIVRQRMAADAAAGRAPVLLGAKITGGGCGGTVCIMGVDAPGAEAALQAVVQQYAQETGHQPKVFSGSSMGAAQFGHLRLRRRQAEEGGASDTQVVAGRVAVV